MFRTLQSFSNWPQIKQQLLQLVQRNKTSQQIVELLRKFQYYSECDQNMPKAKSSSYSRFRELFKQYHKELPQIYAKVAAFVLNSSKPIVPLFYQDKQKEHTFTKQTILYLFCSMMLCLTPKQQFGSSAALRNNFNFLLDFSYIFDDQAFKTTNVIEYIKKQIGNKQSYDQKMTIHRHVQNRSIQEIIKANKDRPMIKPIVQDDSASIEDFHGQLKADFANKYLGGGALLSGCVQEELMFSNHPELYTSQLLCEVMKPNECIFLSGYKKYFKNKGYGWDASYGGHDNPEYTYKDKQACEYITAIDAIHFGHKSKWEQLETKCINRELLKAYCGFSFDKALTNRVITGNWGCGAFGGDLRIKFMIQWLACSALGKEMVYCPFGSRQKIYVQPFLQKFSKLNVGQAYTTIIKASQNLLKENNNMDIYKAIWQELK